jgi:hypothetical protein
MNDVHPFGCLSNVHKYHPSMDELIHLSWMKYIQPKEF